MLVEAVPEALISGAAGDGGGAQKGGERGGAAGVPRVPEHEGEGAQEALARVAGGEGGEQAAGSEGAKVHSGAAESGLLGAEAAGEGRVGANGAEAEAEALAFKVEPELAGEFGELVVLGLQTGAIGNAGELGAKFEGDASAVLADEAACPGVGGVGEGVMAGEAAPMVTARGGEPGVAEGEAGFEEVAIDEVGVGIGEGGLLEALTGVEQAGAAIEEKAGGLVSGDAGGVAVVLAAAEKRVVADEPAVAHDEVVVEHGGRALTEPGEGEDFEFDLDARPLGEGFGLVVQGLAESAFVEQGAAANEDEAFDVVVGGLARGGDEYAAFAAAITAAESEGFKTVRGDDAGDGVADGVADGGEAGFESGAAVAGETGRSGHAAW